MKNRLILLLSFILLFLMITAIGILIFSDNQKEGKVDIKYAVTGTSIVNNRAVVKVVAGVFSGEAVDPFSYVRLVDKFNIPYYPLNGFLKPSLNKGDSLEISFEFIFPRTVETVLEIKDSTGKETKIDVVFPELLNHE